MYDGYIHPCITRILYRYISNQVMSSYPAILCIHCIHCISRKPAEGLGLSIIGISEAKLIGRPEIGPFLKGEAGAWLGRAQKPTCRLPGFLGPNEMLHFGHFWLFSDVFLTFFIGCQKAKRCNLRCFWALGMEKALLATLFAPRLFKKHGNTSELTIFGLLKCSFFCFQNACIVSV